MEQQTLIIIIQILMGIISVVAGGLLMMLKSRIEKLETQNEKLSESLKDYARKEDFREWRIELRNDHREFMDEQKALFKQVFDKLDVMQRDISNKADKPRT